MLGAIHLHKKGQGRHVLYIESDTTLILKFHWVEKVKYLPTT